MCFENEEIEDAPDEEQSRVTMNAYASLSTNIITRPKFILYLEKLASGEYDSQEGQMLLEEREISS